MWSSVHSRLYYLCVHRLWVLIPIQTVALRAPLLGWRNGSGINARLTTNNIRAPLWSRQGTHRDTPNGSSPASRRFSLPEALPHFDFLFSKAEFLDNVFYNNVFITGLPSDPLGPGCLCYLPTFQSSYPLPKCCTFLCPQAPDPIFCLFIILTCWDLNVSCLYLRTVLFFLLLSWREKHLSS